MTAGITMLVITIIVIIVHLIVIKERRIKWVRLTKPMIVVSITLYYVFSSSELNIILIMGLLFSLMGDILLMLDKKFFIKGLMSFAGTHICYMTIFWGYLEGEVLKLPGLLLFSLPYIYCGILLYVKLLRNMENEKHWFVFYLILIETMSYFSLCWAWSIKEAGAWAAFAGTLLFMVSDGALAVGMVRESHWKKDMFVMATYAAAQLLIISGIL